ncbi:TPA: DUF262 domain-containing protein, partial [Vibrio cholerae O1]|nr:DUF262 domain-containing protein [Vibrio cholerae]
ILFELLVSIFAMMSDEQREIMVIPENAELFKKTMWDAISGDEKTSDWESEIYKELGRGFDYSITNSTGKRVTVLYRFRSLVEFINKVPGMIFMPQGMLENENLVMGNKND